MRASSRRNMRPASVLSAGLGLLLVGVAAAPAHAESVRDLQWHLDAMHAEEMWKVSTGRGITVAVIDTGVDDSLPDLKGQVLKGKDYSDQPGDERTDHEGHGTGMAALIAGTGKHGSKSGAYGLAPGVEILPIRMPEKIEGLDFTSGHNAARDFSKAIRFAADSDAKVINISMGQAESGTKGGVDTSELDAAVKYAVDKGKLIFAAAGNEGDGANRPAFLPPHQASWPSDRSTRRSSAARSRSGGQRSTSPRPGRTWSTRASVAPECAGPAARVMPQPSPRHPPPSSGRSTRPGPTTRSSVS